MNWTGFHQHVDLVMILVDLSLAEIFRLELISTYGPVWCNCQNILTVFRWTVTAAHNTVSLRQEALAEWNLVASFFYPNQPVFDEPLFHRTPYASAWRGQPSFLGNLDPATTWAFARAVSRSTRDST